MSNLTEMLLECVYMYPVLYDLNNKDYKNIKKKDRIWDEIGKELKAPGDDLKKKWKNLRDTYAKYLRSTKTSTGQAKKNYKGWQWATHMERFKPFLPMAKTETNVAPLTVDIGENDVDNSELQENQQIDVEQEEIDGENSVEHDEIHETPVTVRKKATKRPNPESNVDKVVKYLESKPKKDIDAVEHFMLGFAKTIKQFSPKRQAETKMEIAQLIFKKEMEQIEENNQAFASRPCSSSTSRTDYEWSEQYIDTTDDDTCSMRVFQTMTRLQ